MADKENPLNILLVEDDQQDIEITQKAFDQANIENNLHVVNDGSDALDYVFHRGTYRDRDKYPSPDLIFLDIRLPRVDGFEVLKRLKEDERYTLIPVIMLTGSKQDGEAFRSFGNGAVSYIQKPVTHELFTQVVDGFNRFASEQKHNS